MSCKFARHFSYDDHRALADETQSKLQALSCITEHYRRNEIPYERTVNVSPVGNRIRGYHEREIVFILLRQSFQMESNTNKVELFRHSKYISTCLMKCFHNQEATVLHTRTRTQRSFSRTGDGTDAKGWYSQCRTNVHKAECL